MGSGWVLGSMGCRSEQNHRNKNFGLLHNGTVWEIYLWWRGSAVSSLGGGRLRGFFHQDILLLCT